MLFVFFVPALSHMFALPLYVLDPMRLAVLGVLLLTRSWKNALVLALMLPLFSLAVSGHPVFPKCLLIAFELSANVLLFEVLLRVFGKASGRASGKAEAGVSAAAAGVSVGVAAGISAAAAALLSIALSKGIYYLLKWALISWGMMGSATLVATALWIQLLVAVAISIVFGFCWKRLSAAA